MFKDNIPARVHGVELDSGKYLVVDDNTIVVDEKDFIHFVTRGRRVSVNLDSVRMIFEKTY